jgi:polar amino acid transport system substrate-binding protein
VFRSHPQPELRVEAYAEIKEERSLKKGFCVLALFTFSAAMSVSAYSQTASPSAASTQGETPELRVAAFVAPPSVMEQNGTLTGFSVDLWNAIAARLKAKRSYQIVPDVSHLEEAMRTKSADLTLGLFITSARDTEFDFSIPTLQAGLQIMVRDTGETAQTTSPLRDMLRLLFSRTTVVWLGIALVLVLIPAHLVWLLERRGQDGIISSPNYFPGIFEAFFWAISTLTGSPEGMPHQWVARTFAIFWIFTGVVFVAFYTAQLTTTLTVEQIRGAIEGPGDLPVSRSLR